MELPKGDCCMSSCLNKIFLWLIFFSATIFGHVALKISVEKMLNKTGSTMWAVFWQPWSLFGYGLWGISCLVWVLVLQKNSLLQANNISSLKYIGLTLAAVGIFHEKLNMIQWVGDSVMIFL
jgi:hypothetical protein